MKKGIIKFTESNKNIRMKHLTCIWITVLLGLMPISGRAQVIDRVVGKVGSEFILLSEIEEEFSYAKTKSPGLPEDLKCDILDNIIAQKLVVYQAKIDSVDVTDEEVELQLDFRFESVLRQMNGDEAFFQEFYGASIAQMKERYKDDQKSKILAEKMQQKLISEIEITPKEVEEFYKSIPYDSIPYFKSEMEISEIVLVPTVNDEERSKALNKITELRNQVVNNEATFSDIASKYSQDPGSALRGGDLGFAKRGVYVPEFEATVFSLAKEELSEVIETEYGFHFIQQMERRGNAVRARHVLIKPEITDADLKIAEKKLDTIRRLILADSMSFEAAVKKYSLKSSPSYSNAGRVKNQNNNSTFFSADDFDPDTYFAIFELKKGEISKPLEISLPGGKKAYRIIRLNSISKPHKANLKQDFDKIANFAKESKKNEYFLKWLDKKRSSTFIYVDPMFGHCDLHGARQGQ